MSTLCRSIFLLVDVREFVTFFKRPPRRRRCVVRLGSLLSSDVSTCKGSGPFSKFFPSPQYNPRRLAFSSPIFYRVIFYFVVVVVVIFGPLRCPAALNGETSAAAAAIVAAPAAPTITLAITVTAAAIDDVSAPDDVSSAPTRRHRRLPRPRRAPRPRRNSTNPAGGGRVLANRDVACALRTECTVRTQSEAVRRKNEYGVRRLPKRALCRRPNYYFSGS